MFLPNRAIILKSIIYNTQFMFEIKKGNKINEM